ncbi:TRAP transporter small permease [Microbaculum marinisediminis]|uniref:TRAP transporter small permease protein n=1 Tax=Microbaculum marinisediminis TaxID=2931392 RepID=A0AAW5R319_9HYPH|nr:TRAP transporter small permease [Microbaculum sp. A6E488]MCT8974229.1 TRAP transporter small permease [Microbaculum sp. A6E488]
MFRTFALVCHRAAQGAVIAILGAILVIVVIQIVLRYGFGASLTWSEEVVRYLLIWLTFVGASVAVREGSLVGLDLLPRFAERIGLGPALNILVSLLGLCFVLATAYYGFQLASSPAIQRQSFSTLPLPMTLVYGAIPLSAGLMAVQLVDVIVDQVRRGRDT